MTQAGTLSGSEKFDNVKIRPAEKQDCRLVEELALIAGDGIPAFFWKSSQQPGQDIIDAGADRLRSESLVFSYRNVQVAEVDQDVAGMMFAHRLPSREDAENLEDLPEFIRPMVELEQCGPESFYIAMLAAFPQFRNQGIGSAPMSRVDSLAKTVGASSSTIIVFDENEGAIRLYIRLGYQVVDSRKTIPHPCHPHKGNLLLLARDVA